MNESCRFIFRTLTVAGILLLFHKSIVGLYDWVLVSLISIFPAGRLIPTGGHYSSSQWALVTLVVLLTVPGFGSRSRIFMLAISLLGYLSIDFFSFLVWLVPPEGSTSSILAFAYTEVWRLFGQLALPILLLVSTLVTRFDQTQVSYSRNKSD